MKKILYIICTMVAFASCNKAELSITEGGQNPDGTYTFKLGIEEPDYAPKTRAAVTMGRYLLEMYEGDLTATPVKMTSTDGVFDVEMKKNTDYVCLFWADGGETAYDATELTAVKQTTETAQGTVAYFARVTVNSKTFNGAIKLQRAVAELSFIDKNGLTEATNSLKITYPYASATFNLGDGTVTHAAGTTVRTIANIVPPAAATTAFATDFVLAPTAAGKIAGLKFQLNEEEEKTIAETAIHANYRTKITGEYVGPEPTMSFTVDTRKNTDSDKTFILPLSDILSGYSLTVDWGDGQKSKFVDGTILTQTDMLHTYATAGVYTITISSSQKDASKQQMPTLFYSNYGAVNKNLLKLISLDSPLLNMGTSLANAFQGCKSLTTIHSELFKTNTLATIFEACFYNCTSLTTIPAGLFKTNTLATTFGYCFSGCSGLTGAIPAELFKTTTLATSFFCCFRDCSGLSGTIPAELFSTTPLATNIAGCFEGCSSLSGAIPADLFSTTTLVTNFGNCFEGCSGLTGAIPAELFKTTTQVTNFSATFQGCTNLTSIPAELFKTTTEVTHFAGCFQGCIELTTLPAELFKTTTLATDFSSCFRDCTGLTTLPAELFKTTTLATYFSDCFRDCTGLTTLPVELFSSNTLATDFSSCFYECTKLKLNANIFCDEATEATTRFVGMKVNFSLCFCNVGSHSSVTDGGTAPALWTYTMESTSNSFRCFSGVTKVTNAADIKTAWK